MPIEDISYTTQPSAESNGRYITVYAPDGSYVSRHNNMEECTESAINYAESNGLEGDLIFRFVPPEKHMRLVKKAIVLPPPVTQTITAQGGTGSVSIPGSSPFVSAQTPGGDPYDLTLGGARTIPFPYSWPTVPSTSNTINVTANSGASLAAAIAQSNVTVVVPAGTYSTSLTSWGNDVDVVCSNGATVVGSIDFNARSRIRWTGGVIGGNNFSNSITSGFSQDIMFNNVRFDDLLSCSPGFGPTLSRYAMINCTMNSRRYCFFSQQTGTYDNVIIAGCDLLGGDPASGATGEESTIRMMQLTTGIVVDCRLNNGAKHTHRAHFECDNIYVADSQLETGAGMMWDNHPGGGGVVQCYNGWVQRNLFYNGFGAQMQGYFPAENDGNVALRFNDNQLFVDGGNVFPNITDTSAGPQWSVTGNTVSNYSAPPAMNVGADH